MVSVDHLPLRLGAIRLVATYREAAAHRRRTLVCGGVLQRYWDHFVVGRPQHVRRRAQIGNGRRLCVLNCCGSIGSGAQSGGIGDRQDALLRQL